MNSGEIYDIRDPNNTAKLHKEHEKLTQLPEKKEKKAWEDSKKIKREKNYDLLKASECKKLEEVENLLDSKKHGDLVANVNARGLDNFTPLHCAVSEGSLEIVKYLLAHGSNIEAQTTSLRTPLHIACNRGNLEIIKELVNSGANINAEDKDCKTPAHILSEQGLAEALEWLLSKNPDLEKKNIFGDNALEVAATIEVAQLLENSPVMKDIEGGYKRNRIQNVIIYTSRSDVVKNLMFKAQIESQMVIEPKQNVIKSAKPKPKREKILELIKEMGKQQELKKIVIIEKN